MEEGELRCVGSSNTVRSEDAENPSTSQQSVETSHAVTTCNYAEVDQHTAPSGNPQRVGALYKDADVLHRWIDSHNVGTSTDAEPSQKENAQWRDRGPDVSGHLGSDCLHSEGREIIAKGIASVLGPVMRDFDAGAEGALKSQGVLASSIDRLTRELDKLLEDAPIPFIIQHATKISGVRKRVLSLNSTLQGIQRRIDNIERMLSGQESLCEKMCLTSKNEMKLKMKMQQLGHSSLDQNLWHGCPYRPLKKSNRKTTSKNLSMLHSRAPYGFCTLFQFLWLLLGLLLKILSSGNTV